jgi:hypothetical protein
VGKGKRNKVMLIFLVVLVLTLIGNVPVRGEFHPIIPLDDNLVGVEYDYTLNNFTPGIGVAYDLGTRNLLGYISASYQFASFLWNLSYGYWTHQYAPGYCYQQGLVGSLSYQIELGHSLTGGIFSGTLQQNREEIRTELVFLDYQKRLYFDWDREIKLQLKTITGKATESDNFYYATILQLPVNIDNFKIRSWLGYCNQTSFVTPYFDLANLIRGYDKEKNTGNRGLAISVEYQWNLFPYSDLPFLGLLNAVAIADVGSVLRSDQRVEEFKPYKSLGAGLVLKLGEFEIHLEKVFNQWGEGRILFYGRG